MTSNSDKKAKSKQKKLRLTIFLFCTGLSALLAYLLFDFKPPGGLVIMSGSAIGFFIGLAVYPEAEEVKTPAVFEMRSDGRWPLVRKFSAITFLIFYCLTPLFMSPKYFNDDNLRRSLFLMCGGLGLFCGTPIMFALKSKLRLLGFCSLFMSLMLIVFGLLGALQIKAPQFVKMLVLAFGMIVPLVIILIYLSRKRAEGTGDRKNGL